MVTRRYRSELRQRTDQLSAATIDRQRRAVRGKAFGEQAGALVESATQFAAPWRSARSPTGKDPLPGYLEPDIVGHCGGIRIDGDVVYSFAMTNIATG